MSVRCPTLTEAIFTAPDPPMTKEEEADLAERIDLILHALLPREAFVLRQRYVRRPRRTLREVADMLAVQRERVRQIEVRALSRLRQRPLSRHLRPGLHLKQTLAAILEGQIPIPPLMKLDDSDLLPKGRNRLLVRVFSLPLGTRAKNALNNHAIFFLGDLVQKKDGELLRYKNFGRKSLKEVRQTLALYGLSLGMFIKDWDAIRAGALARARTEAAGNINEESLATGAVRNLPAREPCPEVASTGEQGSLDRLRPEAARAVLRRLLFLRPELSDLVERIADTILAVSCVPAGRRGDPDGG